MRYKPNELERISMTFDAPMKRLEDEIMTDIVRRIRINSEITRSADWQIHRLYELGMSRKDIEKRIQELTGISPQEVRSLYSQILEKGYAEDEKIYRLKGKPYIPFAENKPLQQLITATAIQTSQDMYNLTQSMGFAVKNTNGLTQFLPIAQYYQDTLDKAMLGITSGAFDYNTVLKKTVAQLTNSGLRTVDYASGRSNRVEVATRRAVMTGFNQIVAKVNEENAEKLGTEYFEVSCHGGARPTHQVWQGRVYSKKDLETVCGLGDVQGLCGANCYHSYHPFFPEIDVRTYTDEQLDEMNRQENIPVEFGGKKYTKYEALQRQRRLETTMRAERQKIKLLQEGGADEDDIITARAKYRVTSSEYTRFSKAMNLPQQRERVTVDGLGNIGVGKYKNSVGGLGNSDIEQFSKYSNVLKENAPKTLEEFKHIKYNEKEKWERLKYEYRTVNRYEIEGDVPINTVLQLDNAAFYTKKQGFDFSSFTGRKKKNKINEIADGGNAATMLLDDKIYFSHSQFDVKDSLEYSLYKGKYEAVPLSKNRKFSVKDLGDEIPREYDTEAKFLEFVATQKNTSETFTVTILSEKHICDSCSSVVEQFKEEYKNATVNIISGKRGYNNSPNGTKTWKHRKKVK